MADMPPLVKLLFHGISNGCRFLEYFAAVDMVDVTGLTPADDLSYTAMHLHGR